MKKEILKVCALRPIIMRKFWASWGADRPPNEVALDQLVLDNGFSEGGASNFLKVYDDTIAYAGLSGSDKIDPDLGGESDEEDVSNAATGGQQGALGGQSRQQGKVKVMDGERVVFTEETNPQNYLKLVASGEVDETMLEALEDYVKRQKKRLETKEAAN